MVVVVVFWGWRLGRGDCLCPGGALSTFSTSKRSDCRRAQRQDSDSEKENESERKSLTSVAGWQKAWWKVVVMKKRA
uniref:Putative secreted protein n=1 Tax=Anopheles marajoara TaxID=58244 RepID=A0A2M4CCC1_9DIPT